MSREFVSEIDNTAHQLNELLSVSILFQEKTKHFLDNCRIQYKHFFNLIFPVKRTIMTTLIWRQ